jgi:hypothetical protein
MTITGTLKHDMTRGTDVRGDYALFIEASRVKPNGWELN